MHLNTTAKGRGFEAEVAAWLKTQGYNDIERNVRVEVSSGLRFECDVHAHCYSLFWDKLRKLGIVVFVIACLSGALKLKSIEHLFQSAISGLDPHLAPYALGIFAVVGWTIGMLGKKRTGHHAWVECKSGKVTRDHVVKLTHITDNLDKNNRADWFPRYVMIFSGVGFDRGALTFARENKIHCYQRTDSGFAEVS